MVDSHSDWAFSQMDYVTVKNVPKIETIWLCASFKYTKSFTCESRIISIAGNYIVDAPMFQKVWEERY